jgi:hypothetical protein
MGRPSTFTDELAATICERLARGEPLVGICRDEAMPGERTVYQWLRQNEQFRQAYVHAREERADAVFDDMFRIADEAAPEDTQRARLMIDTRKWALARMAPKKYGDKTEITGKDGKDLIPSTEASDVARRVAFMLATGAAQAPTKD